jgi:hypothetical protein
MNFRVIGNTALNTEEVVEEVKVEETENVLARTVMNNSYTLWGKRIADIPVDLLDLDHSYQRVETGNAKKIADNWDKDACEFLLVSYRNGKFYIIDGQHRFIAAKIKGIASLPCVIFSGLTRSEEARRFSIQGMGRKKLTPSDTFKANIECGNTDYKEVAIDMEIKRICDKYGITISKSNFNLDYNAKRLRSISRPRIIVNGNGADCFEWIIKTIVNSNWETCIDAYEKDMLMMLKNFYVENVEKLAEATEKIKNVMNCITPREFVAQAVAENPTHTKNTAMKIKLTELTC